MQTSRQWIKGISEISDVKASKKASASAKRCSSRLTPLFSPRPLDLAYAHTSTQANAVIQRSRRCSYVPKYSSLAMACGMVLMTTASITQAQTVTIPSSTSTVVLQTLSPGSTTFDVPAGNTISSTTGAGINGNNSQNWNLTNSGSITGANNGISLSSATASGATVDNFGSITNTGPHTGNPTPAGVYLSNGGTLINEQGATIQSYSDGVDGNASATTVVNNGTIQLISSSSITGVYFASGGGTFTQGATGEIVGTGAGEYGVIDNSGVVNGSNAGTINVGATALWYRSGGTGSFTNTGTLSGLTGVLLATSGNSFTNMGTVSSTSGAAIQLTSTNNSVTLGTGSVLSGASNAAISSSSTGNTITLTGTGTENGDFTSTTTANGFAQLTSSAVAAGHWAATSAWPAPAPVR